jgi:hypothetical protein
LVSSSWSRALGFGGFNGGLELGIGVCCTSFMAEEKNKSKDIVLWIITVILIAVAIFWYKK